MYAIRSYYGQQRGCTADTMTDTVGDFLAQGLVTLGEQVQTAHDLSSYNENAVLRIVHIAKLSTVPDPCP